MFSSCHSKEAPILQKIVIFGKYFLYAPYSWYTQVLKASHLFSGDINVSETIHARADGDGLKP